MRTFTTLAMVTIIGLVANTGLRAQQSASSQPTSDAKAQGQASKSATSAASGADAKQANARPATEQPSPPADPSGSWKWDFASPDGSKLEFVLKLKWDGKKLTGKYTAFESTVEIQDAKLEKDALSFAVRQDFGGFQSEVKFQGKTAKDELKGKVLVAFGDQPQEIDWTAKRFLDVEDVVGVWDLETAGFDGNPFRSTLTITKDDKGLHAKTASDFGDLEASKVEIKDNQLIYDMAPPAQGDFAFKIANKATPRGNVMEGVTQFDFNGQANEMKFTGKRQPPKEEAKPEAARPAAAETKDAAASKNAAKSDAK
jgi:hypothetical protein